MSESRTEQGILDSIPDLGGGDVGGSGGGYSGGSDGSGGGGRSSAPPSQSPTGGQTATTQQGIPRRHDGYVEVQNPNDGRTRDLVDPVTGRVVAQGGIERRVFEEGQRHARENAQLRQQIGALQQQMQGGNEVTRTAQQLNVPPELQVAAIRVMSDFMRDPVKTLEYLVEEVKSKGYQIPFLSQGVTQGMDMNAISRMIDTKMQPITDANRQRQAEAQAQQQARGQLDEFIGANPDSQVNLDVIAEMLQGQPNLSLDRAYLMMVQWAHANGLDPRQSLKQQLTTRQQDTQQPTQQQTRPLPGSRSSQANGAAPANEGGQFSENSSWSDIIRATMRESGIVLQ